MCGQKQLLPLIKRAVNMKWQMLLAETRNMRQKIYYTLKILQNKSFYSLASIQQNDAMPHFTKCLFYCIFNAHYNPLTHNSGKRRFLNETKSRENTGMCRLLITNQASMKKDWFVTFEELGVNGHRLNEYTLYTEAWEKGYLG